MRLSLLFKWFVITALIIFAFIGFSAYKMNQAEIKQVDALNNQSKLEALGRQLAAGSDYLTSEIRRYVQFGEMKHYKNFWREVNETKSREIINDLVALNALPSEIELIKKSKAYSDNLIKTEEQAMAAVKKENFDEARGLVFGEYYDSQKDLIMGNIKYFQEAIHQRTSKAVQDAQKETAFFMFVTNILLLTSGVLIFYALLGITRKRVINPIKHLSELMDEASKGNLNVQESLAIGNKDEIHQLASTFNRMIKELKETRDRINEKTQELIQSQKQAEAAKKDAETANQTKSVFLANMSHELRTPLNSILGFSQVFLHDEALSSKQKQGLGFINKSGNHLLVLINDILDLSKIEAGRIEINPQLFPLKPFVRNIESIMLEQAAAKDLSFIAPEERYLPEFIKADEFRLRQVLFNLISNAIKFTDSGEVRFAVSVIDKKDNQNQTLRFEVTDTGIGIGKEDLEVIFYPFKQIGGLAKSEQGSGLGLAISQKLIALMGGELKVESELAKGSRFWFEVTFPVHKEAPEETVSKWNISGYKGKRLTALIADDKADNLVLLEYMLSNIGFDVVTVTDGRQEVDMAIKVKPDIILTDLKMPVMDGNSAARAIRKVPELADTPIIAVSAGVMDINKEESIQSGCIDFLDKPIQLPELHRVLQKSLNLEWSYEELKEKKVIPPSKLLLPPLDEIKRLMQAANAGNITTLKREISQIREKDSAYNPFANKLEKWSRQYQLDKLVDFLKPYSEKQSHE